MLRFMFVISAMLAAVSAQAQLTLWQNPGTGDWHQAANWSAGVPGSNSLAQVNDGGTSLIQTNDALANALYAGFGNGGSNASGTVIISNRNLTTGFFLFAGAAQGDSGQGEVRATGGTLTIGAGMTAGINLGSGTATGAIHITGSTLFTEGFGAGTANGSTPGAPVRAVGEIDYLGTNLVVSPANTRCDALIGTATASSADATGLGALTVHADAVNAVQTWQVGIAVASGTNRIAVGGGTSTVHGATITPPAFTNVTLGFGVALADTNDALGHATGEGWFFDTAISNASFLVIGSMQSTMPTATATATGSVTVVDSRLEVEQVVIASSSESDMGSPDSIADGTFSLDYATTVVSRALLCGAGIPTDPLTNAPPGTYRGEIKLANSILDVAGTLELGTGSVLRLFVTGPARGAEYSAVNAGTAEVDGTLQIEITHNPAVGEIYELITVSPTGTLSGAFSTIEIVSSTVDPGDVKIGTSTQSSGATVLWAGVPQPPRFSTLSATPAETVAEITGLIPGYSYTIEESADPASGTWALRDTRIPATSDDAWTNAPPAGPAGAFRVRYP